MNNERFEVEERFYTQVADLLETTHDYKPFTMHRKRRWFKRSPGNGRYPGFGLIRMFSPNCIHVILQHPTKINKLCKSPDDALELIRNGIATKPSPD